VREYLTGARYNATEAYVRVFGCTRASALRARPTDDFIFNERQQTEAANTAYRLNAWV